MDVLGQAVQDYFKTGESKDLIVHCSHTEEEKMPIDYFFRSWDQMPVLEKEALNLAKGKILDVGAGVGCHAKVLNEKGFEVDCLEASKGASEVIRSNVKGTVYNEDFFQFKGARYDTIYLLMNGIGIVGSMANLHSFFLKLNELLNDDGQVLLDSSDIIYLYQDDDGGQWVDLNASYYGELEYRFEYNGTIGKEFAWLFLDAKTLIAKSNEYGFDCQILKEGEHYDYLARLTKR